MPPETQKMKMLKEYWDALQESMTRTEFLDAFKKVTELIMQIQQRNAGEMESMNRMHEEMMKKLEGGNSSSIQESKKKMMDYCAAEMQKMYREHEGMMAGMEKMMKDHEEEMKFIYDKVRTMKSGKDADEEVIVGKVIAKIPESTPEQIRDKLESIKEEEEKLAISAIKNLRKELDELKKLGGKVIYAGGGAAGGGGRIVRSYDISASLNGVLKTFSLPAFWRIISVHLSSVPNILRETTDYTFDGSLMTITFTSEINASTSLATGQSAVIIYSES